MRSSSTCPSRRGHGPHLRSLRATCSGEGAFFPWVDGLTRISTGSGGSRAADPADIDRPAAKITTSLPRPSDLLQASAVMLQGKRIEAMRAYEEALALDPASPKPPLMLYWEARNGEAAGRPSGRAGDPQVDRPAQRLSPAIGSKRISMRTSRETSQVPRGLQEHWEILNDRVPARLADYLYDLDEFDQADPLYEKLCAIAPKDPDYPGHLAYCYAAKASSGSREDDRRLSRPEPKAPANCSGHARISPWSRRVRPSLGRSRSDVFPCILAMYAVRFNKGVVLSHARRSRPCGEGTPAGRE